MRIDFSDQVRRGRRTGYGVDQTEYELVSTHNKLDIKSNGKRCTYTWHIQIANIARCALYVSFLWYSIMWHVLVTLKAEDIKQETPAQKYQRLQHEIRELSEQVQTIKVWSL